jgi:tripartite ATP-independent transporter DctM subunit
MASFTMIVVLIGLMAFRVPICVSMGISGFAGLAVLGMPLGAFVRYTLTDTRAVPFLAVPFFILAGNLMNRYGLTRRIFDLLQQLVGFFAGGLAHVTVLTTLVFGGISGSAVATIAGVGTIIIHAMREAGYRPAFAAALTVAASLMDPLVPPSIMFILYAVLMNVSVAKMFLAGIVPGLMLCIFLICNNLLLARFGIERFPDRTRGSLDSLLRSAWRGLPALLTPLVIMRGMTTGLVTPREAGVLAVLYIVFLAIVHGEFSWSRTQMALIDAARTTSLVMLLTGFGSVMGFVMTSERTAATLAADIVALTGSQAVVLSIVVVAILFLGIFLEAVPVLLIAVPLFGPLVVSFGVDPIQFGVVLTFAIMLGIVHPPIGLGIFAVCAVTRLPMEPVVRATLLFYPVLLLSMLLIMFVPQLSTWLPGLVFPGR